MGKVALRWLSGYCLSLRSKMKSYTSTFGMSIGGYGEEWGIVGVFGGYQGVLLL